MVSQNTLEEIKQETRRLQVAQNECVSEYGHIKSGNRYKFQMLMDQIVDLKECVVYLEKLNN